MKKIILLSLTILSSLSLTACANNDSQPVPISPTPTDTLTMTEIVTPSLNTITVNSSESVCVIPDIAQIVYSVRTEAKTAGDCQQQNATDVSKVIELLKSLGVEETSIQTSDYYMHPIYNYSNNTAKVTGYESSTSLTVSDLPISELDAILAESVLSGINTVQSITYMASGYDASYQEALTKAVSAAYEKAKILASACGSEIGNVIMLQETSGYSQARYTDYARSNMVTSFSAAKEEALMDAAGSMMPGEISVEASVMIEYEIK